MEMRFEEIRKLDLEIIDGDRGDNYPSKDDFFSKEYCLFLSTENVTKNGFDFSNCLFINKEKDEKLRKGKLLRNDIIITTRGTVGNIAHYDNSVPFKNIRINSGMLIFRCGNLIVPKYFYYILKAPYFWKQLDNFMSGSAQPQLPKTTLNQMKVLLPSLANQQKIAAVLSFLDDKIALNNRINAKLEQMAKRIYDYWFVQFDFPGTDGKPYKSNGGKMVWNEELKREIPEGWEVKSVNDISVSYRGVGYTSEDEKSETDENVVLILRGNNISNSHIVFDSNTVYLDRTFVSPDQEIHKFDLVMTMSSGSKEHVGKSAMFLYDSLHSYGAFCNKITPNEDCQYFLENYLHSEYFKKYIQVTCSGTGINNLTNEHFDKAKFAFPSDEFLKAFNKKMTAIYEQRGVLEQENLKLTSLRDKLLPLLMNGQVVVE